MLKTYDVGEADRFCILFTRERGRIAARASGARRLQSRLGPSLLPFRHLTVELKEGSAGWVVAGVAAEGNRGNRSNRRNTGLDLAQFAMLEEGIELLLRLVTDEGALPDVFDVTFAFITACHQKIPHASLGYSFALLHCLGLLPEEEQILEHMNLGPLECAYLKSARGGQIIEHDAACNVPQLMTLRACLLEDQLHAPLKAAKVMAAMI